MKTKFLIVATILSLAFTACKDEKKVDESSAAPAAEKELFSVEVEVIAEKDDNFSIFYTEDGTTNFISDNVVWSGIKAKPESQKLVFDLPKEVVPTAIRLDFGINQREKQGNVILEKFRFKYYDKSFEAKGSDFLTYFVKNDSIDTEIDQAKGTIKFKQNTKNTITPFYYPHQILLDEIKKMTN